MTNESLVRFRSWHDLLAKWTPLKEAEFLSNKTVDPKTASAQEIWGVLWDKPLYAYAGVGAAEHWIDSISKATRNTKADIRCAWQTWGIPEERPEVFNVVRVEGRKGKSDKCFRVKGEEAGCFERHSMDMPPRFRLFSIQEAAMALRSMDDCSSDPPFRDLSNCGLSEIVPLLKKKLGWGWGDATVMHALTDMGLAVKPDRHLKRTMTAMGIECEDPIKMNEAAQEMLKMINEANILGTRITLRYLDKVLMDISRLRICRQED